MIVPSGELSCAVSGLWLFACTLLAVASLVLLCFVGGGGF